MCSELRAVNVAARSHKWVEHQKERYKQKAVTDVKPLRRRVTPDEYSAVEELTKLFHQMSQ